MRAGTLEEVEAGRDWAGREGAGAGRDGAERPPRVLCFIYVRFVWKERERERGTGMLMMD